MLGTVLALLVPAGGTTPDVADKVVLNNEAVAVVEYTFPPGFCGEEHAAIANEFAYVIHHVLVAVSGRRAVDLHAVRRQIQEPGLADAGARVERHPHAAIDGEAAVRHLDEEQDVGRHRVRRPVRVRAWTQQRHIWLGLGVFLQEFDGVLDLDDGTLPQPPRPEMSEARARRSPRR
ncbi:MAG: hypothetical protein AUH81_17680 [Candidatus Rokubacteria bacterium 13_1_40CM_4_69_5]|nr:MAG: hypothetical protein AUH81_17680 [Candidatus Rokubacteria bacterium 13_1_40CM_4_69_5]